MSYIKSILHIQFYYTFFIYKKKVRLINNSKFMNTDEKILSEREVYFFVNKSTMRVLKLKFFIEFIDKLI